MPGLRCDSDVPTLRDEPRIHPVLLQRKVFFNQFTGGDGEEFLPRFNSTQSLRNRVACPSLLPALNLWFAEIFSNISSLH